MTTFGVHTASGPGQGALALFELYGDDAVPVLARHFRGRSRSTKPAAGPREAGAALPEAGRARLGELLDREGQCVDEVLLTQVPAAASWSGLAHWSLSSHGGSFLPGRCLEVLEAAGAARLDLAQVLARALAAGTLDALEVAAYEALLGAVTERSALFFHTQYRGALSAELHSLLEGLAAQGPSFARDGAARLRQLLARAPTARRLGEPLRLLLAGRPNAGKSTLFNRLLEADRALVSPRVGTTRDLLHGTIVIEGLPVELFDSAGLHEAPADPVEAAAVERAAGAEVDAVVWLLAPPYDVSASDLGHLRRFGSERTLSVRNFADQEPTLGGAGASGEPLAISALQGHGLDGLRARIAARWLGGPAPAGVDPPAPFTASQRAILESALDRWDSASASLDDLREPLVTCLRLSWPGAAVSEGPSRELS